MLLLLTAGCLAARLSQGTAVSFDRDQPARVGGHTDLDVGATAGVFEVTVGGHVRASPHGVEVAAVPTGCVTLPTESLPLGLGGCLGLTLLGGGAHDGRPTFLIGGPEVQAYATWAPWSPHRTLGELFTDAQGGEPALFLRAGLMTGLDVRVNAPNSPYVGAFIGLEVWTALVHP